jgi:hypothetical protein
MEAGFDSLGIIYNLLQKYGAEDVDESYTSGGRLQLRAAVPAVSVGPLCTAVSNATSGTVVPRALEDVSAVSS